MGEMDERQASIKRLEEKHAAYKRVFETQEGQEVLEDIERNCYTKTTTFSAEALELAYREGMRCVALHIRTMIDLDTEKMSDALRKEGVNIEGDGQELQV